ncbi:hypothetical protein M427DRAFT_52390 [Gonapodya prolifera JEL478]|uniref:Uncharacterized protein n=1 Tax=Gonapodya prolifera (strain JEL478) TaxID=1344416 RepID=A0A139AUG0_GONPJ|nr:hypothetical protein M427DRAFT_52390 [Gonapodya prolifera JEL478]|eukprot:KXS20125.1 hypothetical protein M427DRAFT_52390 [Gonapodya prolifera JEL478]
MASPNGFRTHGGLSSGSDALASLISIATPEEFAQHPHRHDLVAETVWGHTDPHVDDIALQQLMVIFSPTGQDNGAVGVAAVTQVDDAMVVEPDLAITPNNNAAPMRVPASFTVLNQEEAVAVLENNLIVSVHGGIQLKSRAEVASMLGPDAAMTCQVPILSSPVEGESHSSSSCTSSRAPSPISRAESSSSLGSSVVTLLAPPPKHVMEDLVCIGGNQNYRACLKCFGVGGRAPGTKVADAAWSLTNLPCIPPWEYGHYLVSDRYNDWMVLSYREENNGSTKWAKMFVCKRCEYSDGRLRFKCSGKNYTTHKTHRQATN